ncbi:MAG: MerR family transcriptional regulator [Desulfovibrio sp.]|uniref:MerR family transcriptional regulator n=1 Tax=Desulfovibrio sp. 7SRBS1 TaxID=3378064 RepID=UPI003B3FF28A
MESYTVGRLARKFGLSRSTLLYYDSVGLLSPCSRAEGDYRKYGPSEVRRLERILLYRRTGLSLAEIRAALEAEGDVAQALEKRLVALNDEVARLREQQLLILQILKNPELEKNVRMGRARWTEVLVASGFSEQDMRRWHIAFERQAPDDHQAFLEFLCIPKEEIATIRGWAKE